MGEPSSHIKAFADNAERFLREIPVISANTFRPDDRAEMKVATDRNKTSLHFKLVEADQPTRAYWLKYHGLVADGDRNTIFAYFLRFNNQPGGNKCCNKPMFVDIPKHPQKGDPTVLFTAELSGCSVIVTNLNNDMYRVFHDSRTNSSSLYENVVMAVDYERTTISNGIKSTACMQYRAKKWKLLVQLLQNDGSAQYSLRRLPSKSVHLTPVLVGEPVPYLNPLMVVSPPNLNILRETHRRSLESVAEHYRDDSVPFHRKVDEEFQLFEGNKVTQALRAVASTEALRGHLKKLKDKRISDIDKSVSSDTSRSLKDNERFLIKETIEAIVADSESVDYTWLWLKKKEELSRRNLSLQEVVNTDLQIRAPVEGTVGERFADFKLQLENMSNEKYLYGYDHYESISIPKFSPTDMKLLEMKEFLLSPDHHLDDTKRGALLRRIEISSENEYRTGVWQKAELIVKDFQSAGGIVKPMPQGLLVNSVHNDAGGRCYPLVRAISVAIGQKGEAAVDQIMAKMVSLTKTDTAEIREAQILRMCLKELHSNYLAARASTLLGQFTLQEATDQLTAKPGETRVFALNTANHAMLLGVTEALSTVGYHFYDPNFAVVTFKSKDSLVKALEHHFLERGFGTAYTAFGDKDKPAFNLLEINTSEMSRIDIGHGLTVSDLCEVETLSESVSRISQRPAKPVLATATTLQENPTILYGREMMETVQMVDVWREAVSTLEQSKQLGENWMPILSNIEKEQRGHRIQFINLEDPSQTKWISTRDLEFKRFQEYLDERLGALRKGYDYERGSIKQREGITSMEAVDGLSAMFVFKALIEELNKPRQREGQDYMPSNPTLARALEVHGYLNMTQLGQAVVHDASKVVDLTRNLLMSEHAAQESLSCFTRALGRGAVTAGEALGVVFAGASVVLDAIELSHAENEVHKAVFGTQLAFDSANFVVSVGSAGAGMMGASTAAAVLGGASVILVGLGIGFTGLAEALGQVAENAQAVGRYFGDAEYAYKAGGYKYDETERALIPLPGAVITDVNLGTGVVAFDSQYIYRSVVNGSLLVPGNTPKKVLDRSQAINVREGIKIDTNHGELANKDTFTTLVLPPTPKSYIMYDYNYLPFATYRHDYGFDVIRRLTEDGRFYYDFFCPPTHWIIDKIFHQYVDTAVGISLTERSVRLQMPPLLGPMYDRLNYKINGAGGDYAIGLRVGATLVLSSASEKTRWILDGRQLQNDKIKVDTKGKFIEIAYIRIQFADHNFALVLVLLSTGETLQVDFKRHTTYPVKVSADKWPGGSKGVDQHLSELNEKHLLQGQYIVVDNYSVQLPGSTINKSVVGRAYYEISRQRMLYTTNANERLTKEAQLGAAIEEDIYFYNVEYQAIWRVDAKTRTCQAKYNALYNSSMRSLSRVWEEGRQVHATYRHELRNGKHAELTYILGSKFMSLVSVVGDNDLLQKLSAMDRIKGNISSIFTAYNSTEPASSSIINSLPGISVAANTANTKLLSVFGENNKNANYRYWIRLADGFIIKQNFTDANDIVLAGSLVSPMTGKDEHYFYTHQKQTLYRQTGTGPQKTRPEVVSVPNVFSSLLNMLNVDGVLFALTKTGYVLRLIPPTTFFLEAVNVEWLSSRQNSEWWKDLQMIAENHGAPTVSILGIKDTDDSVVPAWYHHGTIVIASSELHGKPAQLLGFNSDGSGVWICSWEEPQKGKLYNQELIKGGDLSKILHLSHGVISSDSAPTASPLLADTVLKAVALTKNGLQCTTVEGIELLFCDDNSVSVVGVDRTWQKANSQKLEVSLALLAKTRPHGEVLALEGDETSAPAWYSPSSGNIFKIQAKNITAASCPTWIGMNLSGSTGYIYVQAGGALYAVTPHHVEKVGNFPVAKRYGDTLILSIPANITFAIPTLYNVKNAIATSSPGGGVNLKITQENWENYDAFIFTHKITNSSAKDTISLGMAKAETLLATNFGADLMLLDMATAKSVTLGKAYGTNKEYTKFTLTAGPTARAQRLRVLAQTLGTDITRSWTTADIEKTRRWIKRELKLSTEPDITLDSVTIYKDKT